MFMVCKFHKFIQTEWFHPVFPRCFTTKFSSSLVLLVEQLNRESPCPGGLMMYRYDKVTVAMGRVFWSLQMLGKDPNLVSMCVCVVCLIIRHGLRLLNMDLGFRWLIIISAINIAMNMHFCHIRVTPPIWVIYSNDMEHI